MFKIKITKNKEKKVENLYTTLNRKQRFLPSLKNEKYRTTFARVSSTPFGFIYTHITRTHICFRAREWCKAPRHHHTRPRVRSSARAPRLKEKERNRGGMCLPLERKKRGGNLRCTSKPSKRRRNRPLPLPLPPLNRPPSLCIKEEKKTTRKKRIRSKRSIKIVRFDRS